MIDFLIPRTHSGYPAYFRWAVRHNSRQRTCRPMAFVGTPPIDLLKLLAAALEELLLSCNTRQHVCSNVQHAAEQQRRQRIVRLESTQKTAVDPLIRSTTVDVHGRYPSSIKSHAFAATPHVAERGTIAPHTSPALPASRTMICTTQNSMDATARWPARMQSPPAKDAHVTCTSTRTIARAPMADCESALMEGAVRATREPVSTDNWPRNGCLDKEKPMLNR